MMSALASFLVLWTLVGATPCLDGVYPQSELSFYETPGYPYEILVQNGLAYVADEAAGLRILDVSDPSAPQPLGSCATDGNAAGLAIKGSLVYVAQSNSGIAIVDVSDPSAPVQVGSLDIGVNLTAIDIYETSTHVWAVAGTHFWGVSSGDAIYIFDVTDPADPTFHSSYPVPWHVQDVLVHQDGIYVSAGSSGVLRFEASGLPADLPPPVSLPPSGTSYGIAAQGDILYVSNIVGVVAFDVSDTENMTELASIETPSGAIGVSAHGSKLLVIGNTYEARVHVYEIGEPFKLSYLGTVRTLYTGADVTMDDQAIYVLDRVSLYEHMTYGDDRGGLHTFAPLEVPFLVTTTTLGGNAWDVLAVDDLIYVANLNKGLQILDASNALEPKLLSTLPIPGSARNLQVRGNLAWVAAHGGGVRVVDVSDPMNPAILDSIPTPGAAWDIALNGNSAYVANGPNGLRVLDITDPLHATTIAMVPTDGEVRSDILTNGPLVYFAEGDALGGRFHIVDASIPSSPTVLGTIDGIPGYSFDGTGYHLAAKLPYIYVAAAHRILTVDVSAPMNPVVTGRFETAAAAAGIAVSGERLYHCDSEARLWSGDLSNPSDPQPIGEYFLPATCFGMTVRGDQLLAAGGNGLHQIPLNCPEQVPVLLVEFEGSASPSGVTLYWVLSESISAANLKLEDVESSSTSSIAIERLAASEFRAVDPRPLTGRARTYLLSLRSAGTEWRALTSYTAEPPALHYGVDFLKPYPNPFNPSVTLAFISYSPVRVRVAVYDIAGREVDVLANSRFESGLHELVWRGVDAGGHRLASGVYLARLEVAGRIQTRKLTLVR